MKLLPLTGLIVLGLAAAYCARLYYLAQTAAASADFGQPTALTACATNKPNCVSSINSEAEFRADPISVQGSASEAMAKLKAAIAKEAKFSIAYESATQLDVTFRTKLFNYPDDARFVIDAAAQKIQFRSQSRVGYSDLGVNRKRIEAIRARIN
jgi:uncharacterized protein (DUF1499 family)